VGVIDAETAPLAGIAAALRRLAEDAGVIAPANEAGRSRLRQAVLAGRRRQAAGRGLPAQVRGAALSAAALAGTGVLVAGAATGTDPATLVRETVESLPVALPKASPATRTVVLEGTVVGVDETAGIIEVQAEEETLTIDVSGGVALRDEKGVDAPIAALEVGDAVRITGSVTKRDPTVDASKVEITVNATDPVRAPSAATTVAVEPTPSTAATDPAVADPPQDPVDPRPEPTLATGTGQNSGPATDPVDPAATATPTRPAATPEAKKEPTPAPDDTADGTSMDVVAGGDVAAGVSRLTPKR
jgi:hypothetical protein